MPSLHHGAIFIGVMLIVTGGSTAFLPSSQNRLQAFSLCCVVLGAVMLILGLFWAMNGKNTPVTYSNEYAHDYSHVLFAPPHGNHFPESQSVYLQRWVTYCWAWNYRELKIQSNAGITMKEQHNVKLPFTDIVDWLWLGVILNNSPEELFLVVW